MNDAVIIGGGPGGLYLSILLKRDRPHTRVRVIERGTADTTFGFGVAFHDATLRKLAEADPISREAIGELLRPWDDVAFQVRGIQQRVGGHGFSGCSRQALLHALQQRARELGVELIFERTARPEQFPEADLVVAADGANSRIRASHAGDFEPTVVVRPNRYVWLGTSRPLDAMNFFFVETSAGVFVAHAYPHQPGQSTWIVETDDETFARSGLRDDDEAATVHYLEAAFAEQLAGHRLTTNRSVWRQFPLIDCRMWSKDRLVLLGDAKGTVHYSMGSGTKLAMEDAVALNDALQGNADVSRALAAYEDERRPAIAALQRAGYGSMLWFEQVRMHWPMPTDQFIFAGVTRKSNETYESVYPRNSGLVRAATAALASGSPAADPAEPCETPLQLGTTVLPNRLATLVRDNARANEIVLVDPHQQQSLTEHGDPTLVALCVEAPHDPADALGLVEPWLARGVSIVALTSRSADAASRADQLLTADLLRHSLGVTTIVDVASRDEANTALAAGRTDLVRIIPGA